MKKAIIFAVCATLALSAVGCKNYKDEKSAPDTKVETKDEKSINGAEKTENKEADKKTEEKPTPPRELSTAEKITQLKAKLSKAIEEQEYEMAAQYRDEIKLLEKKLDEGGEEK